MFGANAPKQLLCCCAKYLQSANGWQTGDTVLVLVAQSRGLW